MSAGFAPDKLMKRVRWKNRRFIFGDDQSCALRDGRAGFVRKTGLIMGAMLQQTLRRPVKFAGVGLHSGQDCAVTVQPAPANTGVIFYRTDLQNCDQAVPAHPDNVLGTRHGTALANAAGVTVSTVEHLMAALRLSGVDNAAIDVFGPEAPILDGSSAEFVDSFRQAGVDLQSAPRLTFTPLKTTKVVDGDRFIEVRPSERRTLEIEIDFGDCMIGRQSLRLDLDDPADRERLVGARTFCRLEEIEPLRAAGLIRGGSLDNSIVVNGDRLVNKDALRDQQEFALHKALDLIGDLYLLGAPLGGAIRAVKPGHDLNVRMAQTLAGKVAPKNAVAERPAVAAAIA